MVPGSENSLEKKKSLLSKNSKWINTELHSQPIFLCHSLNMYVEIYDTRYKMPVSPAHVFTVWINFLYSETGTAEPETLFLKSPELNKKKGKIHECATAVKGNYNIWSWLQNCKRNRVFHKCRIPYDKHWLWLGSGNRIKINDFSLCPLQQLLSYKLWIMLLQIKQRGN